MLLIAVGKLRQGPEQALFDRYTTRLRPKLQTRELGDGTGTAVEIKRREGAAMSAALPATAFVVALDPAGQSVSSEELAVLLGRWSAQPQPLVFTIGGAEGLGDAVLAQAGYRLALGPMTWPHMLARVMLVEQLYRAQSIMAGHPYHRG